MKAIQSKRARVLFTSESKGRELIRLIHKASSVDTKVVATEKIDKKNLPVKEL
jgi:hypothetical protein